MKLHNVITPSYLIVDPDSSIVDLAYLLGLDVDVDLSHDHFHIHSDAKHKFQALTSYRSPTLRDVRVSPEVFSKILIDVASGMEIKTAFENKDTPMKMIKVRCCNQVITPLNQQVLDLAAMLSIGIEYLCSGDQYIYLDFLSTPSVQMAISSQVYIHENDVVISSEIFTEILIDVASGIPINDALFKQNILISY